MPTTTRELLLRKYRPQDVDKTEGAPAPSSIVEINKSALPDLFAFDNVGQWFAACEMYLASFPEKLRDVIIKQALAGYLKE